MTSAMPHPLSLAEFQDAFAHALTLPAGDTAGRGAGSDELVYLFDQPGFAVYRNTVTKGCVDALQANYPAIVRLVGEAWFRAAAVVFARAHPPSHPALLDYGAGFADFLAAFPPAQELSYLPGVARIERFWTEAHVARDEVPVAAAAVAVLDVARLGGTVLRPHASARWAWFDQQPIRSIWERNRDGREAGGAADAPDGELEWCGEGVLIVRPEAAVRTVPLDRAGCAFLDACSGGGTLADAAAAALAVDSTADLSALLAQTLAAGAYGRLVLPPDDFEEPR
jgi:hypothetical protein